MKENFDTHSLISSVTLKQMRARHNRESALRLSIQLGIFIGFFTLLATTDLPIWLLIPTLAIFGFVIFALYAPLHETTHETAFASRKMNRIGAWITGLLYGYSPGVHAGFHFEHHRYTNQEKDPEKEFSLPEMPGRTLFQICLAGVLGMMVPLHSLALSIVPVKYWDQIGAHWTQARKRPKLQWGSRAVAAFWITGFLAMALINPTMIWYCLIGMFIGRMIHGVIVVTEHEGLEDHGHMFNRTRTTISNSVYRWFWWNMNYHSEHHAWPAVPWHNLPELHEMTRAKQSVIVKGYSDFFLKGQYQEIRAGMRRNAVLAKQDDEGIRKNSSSLKQAH